MDPILNLVHFDLLGLFGHDQVLLVVLDGVILVFNNFFCLIGDIVSISDDLSHIIAIGCRLVPKVRVRLTFTVFVSAYAKVF